MKKRITTYILCIFVFGIIFLLQGPALAWAGSEPGAEEKFIDAKAAILIDAGSGKILYEDNAREALPPASLTKVLTALLVVENTDFNQSFTLPVNFDNPGETTIYLAGGETHTILDLFYAMMMTSANDAAVALAIAVSGSQEAFVELMNRKTRELGLKDSTWYNPHGLSEEGHLASAYDLAIIAREACKDPVFNQATATGKRTMPRVGHDDRQLNNRNQLLGSYEGADGIKTGYTRASGSCLMASATRDGMRLIGIVLNCNEMYTSMEKLLDYGFENFYRKDVAQAGDTMGNIKVKYGKIKEIPVVLDRNISMIFDKRTYLDPEAIITMVPEVETPVAKNQPLGTVTYTDADGTTISADLVAGEAVERYTLGGVIRQAFARIWAVLVRN